jgi:predicted Zn-dependent protease
MAVGLVAVLGGSLWADEKPATATTAAATAPDHAKSYYHFMLARRYKELAGIYNRSDYVDRAVSEYKQAIAADPDSLFLRVELAELYSVSGHTAEGIAEAEAVLKVDPDYPDAHRMLSRIYYHMLETAQGDQGVSKENLAKAIEHLQALERVAPSDTDSMLLLGHLYRVNNQPEKAEAVFRKVLQVSPDSRVGLANLGELYIQQNAYDQDP